MNVLETWNSLTWVDGALFSAWLGMMYYGKCWVDHKFRN